MRKGEGANGQRAKVTGNFSTEGTFIEFPSRSCLHMNVFLFPCSVVCLCGKDSNGACVCVQAVCVCVCVSVINVL